MGVGGGGAAGERGKRSEAAGRKINEGLLLFLGGL